jgi:hypothetical protein
MARIIMDRSGLRELELVVDRVKGRTAEDVASDARRYCPVDTGDLVGSIRARGNVVWVGTDHWAPTEYGSRPHLIVSHGPWPLRNRETGQVFGRVVHHPGTPAQPFMRPAVYMQRGLRP